MFVQCIVVKIQEAAELADEYRDAGRPRGKHRHLFLRLMFLRKLGMRAHVLIPIFSLFLVS